MSSVTKNKRSSSIFWFLVFSPASFGFYYCKGWASLSLHLRPQRLLLMIGGRASSAVRSCSERIKLSYHLGHMEYLETQEQVCVLMVLPKGSPRSSLFLVRSASYGMWQEPRGCPQALAQITSRSRSVVFIV
jgi:hypothetical protein